MPRAKHVDTKVQRAEVGETVSQEDCERGYEPTDASSRQALIGMAGFVALLLSGLGIAGVLLPMLAAPTTPRDLFARERRLPPGPGLIVESGAERRALEREAEAHLGSAAARAQAEARLIARGWPNPDPAPSPESIARGHRESLR